MEEESGLKLQEMARGWLKRSNHPQVRQRGTSPTS